MGYNFDHQRSLSKSNKEYSNNCLHFLKCAVPLNLPLISGGRHFFLLPLTSSVHHSNAGEHTGRAGPWLEGALPGGSAIRYFVSASLALLQMKQ